MEDIQERNDNQISSDREEDRKPEEEKPTKRDETETETGSTVSNPHLLILQKYKNKQVMQKQEEELKENQKQVIDGESNPHAAIIARHLARKVEKEQKEKEDEVLASEALKRRETVKRKEEDEVKKKEEVEKRSEMLLNPLQPMIGILSKPEGSFKTWKERLCYIEDKEPLEIRCYKQTISDADLLEVIPITYDTILDKNSLTRSGSSLSIVAAGGKSKENSTFQIVNKQGTWKFSATTEAVRDEWIDFLTSLLQKYASAVESIVPQGTIKSNSSVDSLAALDKKKKKISKSVEQFPVADEPVINPFADETIGTNFRNPLFET